jgi:broad specificity phosphatase PhoE
VSDCVWLLRHGDTEWSEAERHTGLSDPVLSEAGRDQARAAGELLAGRSFHQVLVSPQRRARETCELAGYGADAAVEPLLVEWDYGDFEGISERQSRERRPGWDLFYEGAPGGERLGQIAARADSLLATVDRCPGRCLLVGHGKFLRAVTARWLQQPLSLGSVLPFDPAALAILERERGRPLLRAWNRLSALPS